QANANYPGELGGAHIRDPYVQALSQQGDLYLDERTHQSCILYVNGQYWGVYEIREKVDDADFLDYYYDQDEQWKDSPNHIQYLKTWGGTWEKYGAPNAQNDWNTLLNFVTTNNMATPANFAYVTSQYKWKSLVDYFVLNSYILNQDMLNWNTSWWRGLDTNGSKKKWRYTLWDMDATFNHYTNYTGIPSSNPAADPCNIDNLPNPGGQGHTVILSALMNNPTFEQYYISRYIDLSNTTFKCTNMIAVLDSLINIITPEMPGQINRWGGTMAEWTQNVNDMRAFINARCAAMNVGLVGCYNVTGPYPIQVNVTPVGSGDAKINSVTPTNYVYSGNYFGNIDILLKATPNTGYMFDHWEVFNHTLDSVISNENNSLQITQADSIVAHFIIIGDTVELTFNVDVPGGGDIAIDGFTPPAYSYSNFYPETSTLNLVATPTPGYLFINWTSNSTPFVVLSTDPSVSIVVDQVDSIVAHFAIIDTFDIEYRVSPLLMGEITIDSNAVFEDVTSTSIIKSYMTGITIDLTETPISNFLFDRWGSNLHTLTPSVLSSNVSFIVSGDDVITAYYVEEVIPPPKGAQVPMAFSPNDDGNNDILYVYGGQIESLTFDVYDRWGEKVFTSSSPSKGWDGNFNGKKAASGVYVYKLKAVFTDGDIENKSGNITLVR
ncbi:MAG: CotH kinase family protein, partial [Flavobacteriales bacterium]|nr:CotH kinase family protein [Flavobacteriales bacterium]